MPGRAHIEGVFMIVWQEQTLKRWQASAKKTADCRLICGWIIQAGITEAGIGNELNFKMITEIN
jgi:hypothetical protein